MAYFRNQPVASDDLDVSQPFLVVNTNGADDSFGVDHYKFSDLTANNGKHNNVTTPLATGGVHPTTTTDPKIYGMQDTAPIGLIQYSRGINNAVPTPITSLHSPAAAIVLAPGATSNVLDFSGISIAYATLTIYNASAPLAVNVISVFWNGSVFTNVSLAGASPLSFSTSGSILQIKNNNAAPYTNVYWTLQLIRVQV